MTEDVAKPRLKTEEFDFHLPRGMIAARPARPRDSSRLLEVGAELHDHVFRDLPSLLSPAISWFSTTPASSRPSFRALGGRRKSPSPCTNAPP
jgi:S-adenosylmethionine:tRNA ribosyltransferase-isomerase